MAQAQAVQNVPKGSGDGSMTTGNPANPTDWSVGWHPLFWGCGLIMLANVFFWYWNYAFMFTAGLNSASAEFTLYYWTLFWGELIVLRHIQRGVVGLAHSEWPGHSRAGMLTRRRDTPDCDFVEPRWRDESGYLSDGQLLAELGRIVAPNHGA